MYLLMISVMRDCFVPSEVFPLACTHRDSEMAEVQYVFPHTGMVVRPSNILVDLTNNCWQCVVSAARQPFLTPV